MRSAQIERSATACESTHVDPRNKVCNGDAAWVVYTHDKVLRLCDSAASRVRKAQMEGQACGRCRAPKAVCWILKPIEGTP